MKNINIDKYFKVPSIAQTEMPTQQEKYRVYNWKFDLDNFPFYF
jgi:hypothetical protein